MPQAAAVIVYKRLTFEARHLSALRSLCGPQRLLLYAVTGAMLLYIERLVRDDIRNN